MELATANDIVLSTPFYVIGNIDLLMPNFRTQIPFKVTCLLTAVQYESDFSV
jgi:hypothetical protein